MEALYLNHVENPLIDTICPLIGDDLSPDCSSIVKHSVSISTAVVLLFLFDVLVASRTSNGRDDSRWFKTHAFGNFFVVLSAFPAVYAIIDNPLHCMDSTVHTDRTFFGSASRWPLSFVNAIHIYHVLAWKLNEAEIFHHMLFVPLIGLSGQVYSWGPMAGFIAFFISGLPGGIDYAILAMVKDGYVTKMVEKQWSANLNVWLRCPGILTSTILVWQTWRNGNYTGVPDWAFLVQLTLPPFNAIYYCKQSVANYAVHYIMTLYGLEKEAKDKIKMRLSKTTNSETLVGMELNSMDPFKPQLMC